MAGLLCSSVWFGNGADEITREARPDGLSEADFLWLQAANRAPSGHNTQPWFVQFYTPDTFAIQSVPARWLPVADPNQRETLLSVGAYAEALRLAALGQGYLVTYEVQALDRQSTTVLVGRRVKTAAAEPIWLQRLQARRTVRKGLRAEPVRPADLRALTAGEPAPPVYFSRQSREGRLVAEATLAANREQSEDERFFQELSDWIRWTESEKRRYGTGLTPASMELDSLAQLFVRLFYTREDVLKPEFRAEGLKQVADQLQTGGGWLVLTGDDTPAGLLACGASLMRLWLKARELGIAIHPMSQALEVDTWRNRLPKSLGLEQPLQFLLRVGYHDQYAEPVSIRQPVKQTTGKASF